MNIRNKVMQIANRLCKKFTRSIAMQKAWRIAKVICNKVISTILDFEKKDGTVTTREIANISNYYTFKGTSNKPTASTILKFVDLNKYKSGEKSFIISFHINQIL